MKYNNTPSEDVEQTHLFTWAACASGKYPELDLMHHIPNGGKRGKAEAARFKAQGVKAGVPDIFLPCAKGGYHGLYIELKRVRGGRVSSAQEEFIKALRKQGYRVEVCFGMEQAQKVIVEYLEVKND
ncbi:MAG: VRR-NUC domain-containing protein [Oscillospiraceae bacterium]